MVFDAHLHERAWVEMIQHHNNEATEEEIIAYIHGRTNDKTIAHFIGEVTAKEQQELSDEKEKEYQRLVRKEGLDYVAGTEELLDELVKREIPFTIATASPEINIDFYFDYFKLARWFKREEIIFDDGTFPGKPDPTIYERAAASLHLEPEECIVIEDAIAGIQSANRAGIGKVVAMLHAKEQEKNIKDEDLAVDEFIWDFNDFLQDHFD